MTNEAIFVFALIFTAGVMMASNRVRYDLVALLVVIALMLSGVLTVGEALSGFGSSVVILVAALLVIGEMLVQTGFARAVSDWILKNGGSNETRLLILLMVAAGMLGAVMSSTAVVAIFIPIVLRISTKTNLRAHRLLLPMSYAALISGMLTLIATPPNIVMHEELKGAGYEGFGFFSIAPVGLAVLVAGIFYIVLIGRRLLPRDRDASINNGKNLRSIKEIWSDFQIGEDVAFYRIENGSPLAGKTLSQVDFGTQFGVRIIGISRSTRRGEQRIPMPGPSIDLRLQDSILVVGDPQKRTSLFKEQGLTVLPESPKQSQRWFWELGGAVTLIHPNSQLIGTTIRESEFRSTYGLQVLGIRHSRQAVDNFEDWHLHPSDSLLVVGRWKHINRLQSLFHDFVLAELPAEHSEVVPSYQRMPIAVTILVGMVVLTVFDVVPLVTALLIAVVAAVVTRCLTMEDAYRAIHWSSLVLIAGMLPLADALNKSGGTRFIVDALLADLGNAGPHVMLSILFFLTAGIGLVLSNTASAVLVAPIAIYAAQALNVSPHAFAVAVAIAASAAYSTPVSTPVVTLVVEPGAYSFVDFVKVGMPLLGLTYLVTLIVAPLVYPF